MEKQSKSTVSKTRSRQCWNLKQSMGARQRAGIGLSYRAARDGIFKFLRSLGIDSKGSIQPAYVVVRAGTTTLFLVGALDPNRLF
jgi:hypothetical protein